MKRRPTTRKASAGLEDAQDTPVTPEADETFNQRATFYFSEDQLLSLEVVMLKLRTEQRMKVGKAGRSIQNIEALLGLKSKALKFADALS